MHFNIFGIIVSCLIISVWKMHGYPLFSFGIQIALAKICFSHMVLSRPNLP